MTKQMPPVPPAGRSDKGPGSSPEVEADTGGPNRGVAENADQQGRTGNSKINTTHQGYQQDR